jgi:hypothetical protein
MARYPYGGKTTVESCRYIDVLDWHRRDYLRSPRWFSWAWCGIRCKADRIPTEGGQYSDDCGQPMIGA